jgi:hypothetical protein
MIMKLKEKNRKDNNRSAKERRWSPNIGERDFGHEDGRDVRFTGRRDACATSTGVHG